MKQILLHCLVVHRKLHLGNSTANHKQEVRNFAANWMLTLDQLHSDVSIIYEMANFWFRSWWIYKSGHTKVDKMQWITAWVSGVCSNFFWTISRSVWLHTYVPKIFRIFEMNVTYLEPSFTFLFKPLMNNRFVSRFRTISTIIPMTRLKSQSVRFTFKWTWT